MSNRRVFTVLILSYFSLSFTLKKASYVASDKVSKTLLKKKVLIKKKIL